MKKKKTAYFSLFCETLDISLIVFQSFDTFSYKRFLEELRTTNRSSELVIVLSLLRVMNRIDFFNKNLQSKQLLFLLNSKVFRQQIKQILLILSKNLNISFCKQKFNLIYFFIILENTLFANKIKIFGAKDLITLDFWFLEYKKRAHFFIKKLVPKTSSCPPTVYLFISYFYMLNGLNYLNFYKNLQKEKYTKT